MEQLLYFCAGMLVTILVTHVYHKRAAIQTPEWAERLIAELPSDPPTLSELLRLFQRSLDAGDVYIHPVLQKVACPDCGASASEFEEKVFGDDKFTVLNVSCPSCGWSESADVS